MLVFACLRSAAEFGFLGVDFASCVTGWWWLILVGCWCGAPGFAVMVRVGCGGWFRVGCLRVFWCGCSGACDAWFGCGVLGGLVCLALFWITLVVVVLGVGGWIFGRLCWGCYGSGFLVLCGLFM